MARIVLADDGLAFDGKSAETGTAGGAETAFVRLAEELAKSHEVRAFTRGGGTFAHRGVAWADLAAGLPDDADLYVANRGHRLLDPVPRARRTLFWLHNDARYLLKFRYLARLWRRRPTLVFVSRAHAASAPRWVPDGGRAVIPLGLDDTFRGEAERVAPPPVALFAANPLRGLDELVRLWKRRIAPAVPAAKLDLRSGTGLYGAAAKSRTQARMQAALDAARAAADGRLSIDGFVPRAELPDLLRRARVFLYPGDPTETFCLSVAEAQAMGVPCVVLSRGALPERVIDGETGFVAADEDAFAAAAVRLLTDDALWLAQHRACLSRQRARGWADMAA
ncbi:MAG: glycosyltransferase family 4 protein, partial [Rhodospirillales bacterium]|nr:glycosyltransferase family 4 protein [Rhodospirillales bacterium]